MLVRAHLVVKVLTIRALEEKGWGKTRQRTVGSIQEEEGYRWLLMRTGKFVAVCFLSRNDSKRLTHLPCPSSDTVTLRKITNADFSDRAAVQKLADQWKTSEACKNLITRLDSPSPAAVPPRAKLGCLSNVRQLQALTTRAAINSARDPGAYAFRCSLKLFAAYQHVQLCSCFSVHRLVLRSAACLITEGSGENVTTCCVSS